MRYLRLYPPGILSRTLSGVFKHHLTPGNHFKAADRGVFLPPLSLEGVTPKWLL